MFNNGLCSQKAGLYEAWAWYLETSKAFKKAESVFKKGIAAMTDTESKERLTMRQKQFQQRVIRRMNGEEIPDEEVEEEKRSALGQLRGHGKHGKVASVRVGQAKLGGPGVLQVGAAGNGKQPLRTNNSQAGFTIFSDENSIFTHQKIVPIRDISLIQKTIQNASQRYLSDAIQIRVNIEKCTSVLQYAF